MEETKAHYCLCVDTDHDQAMSFLTNSYITELSRIQKEIKSPFKTQYWPVNDEMTNEVSYYNVGDKVVLTWSPSSNKVDWDVCRDQMEKWVPGAIHRKCSITELYYLILDILDKGEKIQE